MFSKETYQNRRAVIRNKMREGVLLFLGNIENPMNFADNPYPFRQDSSFLYYFGIQQPKMAAAIDVDSDETILFGDELSIDEIVWMGSPETIQTKAERSGVSIVHPYQKLFEYVRKVIAGGREVHFLPPYQSVNKILLSNLLDTAIVDLQPSEEFIRAIVAQRAYKEAQEVVEIEKAVNVSNEMHLLAMRMAKPGVKEYEIVNAMQHLAADAECGFSYPSILSVNGEILHNHYHGNTLKEGDMILNDSGAETAMGYAGDLTRTFPVSGKFTTRQRELYSIVLKALDDATAIMKPGINFKEVHLRSALTLTAGLKDLGLVKGNVEEAVANNVFTLFFQCGVGHFMGLDVHDMEDLGEKYVGYTADAPKDTKTFGWKSLRLGRALEENHVVTVEPGLYFIPQLIDSWQKENKLSEFINYDKVNEYRNFGGIRIEDDYLITKNSYRKLGNGLIRTVEDVEDYCSAN